MAERAGAVSTTRSARAPEPGHPGRLGHRRVRLGGEVDPLAAVDSGSRQSRRRCGAAPRAAPPAPPTTRSPGCSPPPPPAKVNAGPRPSAAGQPVQQHLLQLGRRRRGRPQHALGAEPAGEQVAQQRVQRGVGREVAEEAGVLPVRAGRDERPRPARRAARRSAAAVSGSSAGSRARTQPGATAARTGRSASPAR